MRRHIIAIVTVGLLATGCSGGSDGNSDAKPSASASTPVLSTEWVPKLKDAMDAEATICNQVGDQACAEHLTDIALVVSDLRFALEEAGGVDAYPRSMAEVDKVDAAVDAYTDHECLGDENAGIAGSPCPDDAHTIISGGKSLQLTLETDELKQ